MKRFSTDSTGLKLQNHANQTASFVNSTLAKYAGGDNTAGTMTTGNGSGLAWSATVDSVSMTALPDATPFEPYLLGVN